MSKVSCKFHPEAALIEDYRAGDQICSECGLVVGDRVIDVGSEWRHDSGQVQGSASSRNRRSGVQSEGPRTSQVPEDFSDR